jgi:hypothetical protein
VAGRWSSSDILARFNDLHELAASESIVYIAQAFVQGCQGGHGRRKYRK